MPKCFVITGYGIKKDYINNREIDLDKSFKYIIKPVFEELGYECKRSCDYPPGVIDTIMYQGIYYADFVIADLSTLNPNALYELGVRHALRPFTTLIICEDGIFVNNKLPFDLSHLTALSYHHDGKSLDVEEVDKFKLILKNAITGMLNNRAVDSPVFAHISGLEVLIKEIYKKENETSAAEFLWDIKNSDGTRSLANELPGTTVKTTEIKEPDHEPSFSDMIDSAIALIKEKKFEEAIDAFAKLHRHKPDNPFFIQQCCLATYKSGKPDPVSANVNAYKILELVNPETSIDVETLGMAGAIHKNLFELTSEKKWVEKSLHFYERGYYIANDYYNGINTAFLHWQMADLVNNKDEILFYKMQAQRIAKNVVEICNNLMKSENYSKRNDKEWITNTITEAYFGLDDGINFSVFDEKRKKEKNGFSEESFRKQFEKLKTIKENVEKKLKN